MPNYYSLPANRSPFILSLDDGQTVADCKRAIQWQNSPADDWRIVTPTAIRYQFRCIESGELFNVETPSPYLPNAWYEFTVKVWPLANGAMLSHGQTRVIDLETYEWGLESSPPAARTHNQVAIGDPYGKTRDGLTLYCCNFQFFDGDGIAHHFQTPLTLDEFNGMTAKRYLSAYVPTNHKMKG